MDNFVVLAEDFDEVVWELVQNTLEEIEVSQSGHPNDPDTWPVGYAGDSVFAKHLTDQIGDPVRLLFQVSWTAIDPVMRYRRQTEQFDPDIKILSVLLVGPEETVYLLDNPTDQIDPGYTWQTIFQDDQNYLAVEALQDAGDQLFIEVR